MARHQTVIIGVPDPALSECLYRHLGNRSDVAVVTVHHLEEILLHVLEGDADVVVLDLDLPGADGQRAMEVLRRAGPTVVLVVLSSDEGLARGRAVLRHGIFYYGIKPAPEIELLAGVDQALAHSAERRTGSG